MKNLLKKAKRVLYCLGASALCLMVNSQVALANNMGDKNATNGDGSGNGDLLGKISSTGDSLKEMLVKIFWVAGIGAMGAAIVFFVINMNKGENGSYHLAAIFLVSAVILLSAGAFFTFFGVS